MDSINFKQARVNLLAGVCNKIILMLVPFATRAMFIHFLSIELLGVSSLFTSILQILNIAELGVGSAITYFMYQPIVEKDTLKVCKLLNFYKRVYMRIGVVTIVIGIAIMPFLDTLILGEIPNGINLQLVFMLYVINTCIGYFFYAYKTSLLYALQQVNKIDNINTVLVFIFMLFEIISLTYFKNFYMYITVSIIKNISNNLCCAWVAKKNYPEFKCEGDLDKETYRGILRQVKGLLISNVCAVSRNSLDSICISMFLGLAMITHYTNYYMILNLCIGLLSIIQRAMQPAVGQSIAKDSKEKNYHDMMNANFLYMTLSGWVSVSMLCLFQPFMEIWMGKEMLFPMKTVFILVLYFYVLTMGNIRTMYVQGAGLWWEGKFRAILEAITNITLNFVLGYYWGINGIILATLLSLFIINFCYGSSIVFRHYFKGFSLKNFYIANIKYTITTCIVGGITYIMTNRVEGADFSGFLVRAFICIIVPWALYFIIYMNTKEAKNSVKWLKESF